MALLSHPLDVHYAVKGIDGWPRVRIEVYGVDSYGRIELAGYGCCIIPTAAGTHELRCSTWRPCGSMREQFSSFFLGGGPRLKHKELITSPSDRFRLQTEPAGEVLLKLSVLPKDLLSIRRTVLRAAAEDAFRGVRCVCVLWHGALRPPPGCHCGAAGCTMLSCPKTFASGCGAAWVMIGAGPLHLRPRHVVR